jgi:hypothetical protein
MPSVTDFEFDSHVDPDYGFYSYYYSGLLRVLCVQCVWCKETLDRLIVCCSCSSLSLDHRHSLHQCGPAFSHIKIEMKIEARTKIERIIVKLRCKMK